VNPKTKHPVIALMDEQKKVKKKGGTMRLGSYKCHLEKGSIAAKAYGRLDINERHRHRYEFHNGYKKQFSKSKMQITGVNPESNLVEIIELKDHPYFIGVQFHPELKSTVEKPHPLFVSFVKATLEYKLSK